MSHSDHADSGIREDGHDRPRIVKTSELRHVLVINSLIQLGWLRWPGSTDSENCQYDGTGWNCVPARLHAVVWLIGKRLQRFVRY
jgi:hypothetical protein